MPACLRMTAALQGRLSNKSPQAYHRAEGPVENGSFKKTISGLGFRGKLAAGSCCRNDHVNSPRAYIQGRELRSACLLTVQIHGIAMSASATRSCCSDTRCKGGR